jgi:hypothetical protein
MPALPSSARNPERETRAEGYRNGLRLHELCDDADSQPETAAASAYFRPTPDDRGEVRLIGAKFGQLSSSEAFHELAVGVGPRESAHDTHDRAEGPTGTIGIVAQAEDA